MWDGQGRSAGFGLGAAEASRGWFFSYTGCEASQGHTRPSTSENPHVCVCLLGSKLAETGRVYSCGSQNTKAGVGVRRRAPEILGA